MQSISPDCNGAGILSVACNYAMCKSKSNARKCVTPEDMLEHNFGTEPVSRIHDFISLQIPATDEGVLTLIKWGARFGLSRTKSGRNDPTDRAGFGLKQECLRTFRKSKKVLLPTNNVLFMFNRR